VRHDGSLLGILGAIGAVLYWRYTASLNPAFLPADWKIVAGEGLIYAASGFVGAWVIGFAFS